MAVSGSGRDGDYDHAENGSGVGSENNFSSLVARATTLRELSNEELRLLSRNYTRHPLLALLYFHCCATHPAACVHNDEVLDGVNGKPTVARLDEVLDEPISAETMRCCQERVSKTSGSAGDLWVCASCCELVNTVDSTIEFVAIQNLHSGFKLTASQLREIDSMPKGIVDEHVQILRVGNEVFHLNPELVPDTNAIPLCSNCAGDPRMSEFSIASGHDYGRIGCLPELNEVASKCITPVRSFGLSITASGKHTVGHSICFPSSGPAACSSVLPCTSEDCIPSVTFIGPHDEWRVVKKKYKNLYELPVESMYAWMRVLAHTHSYFKETGIQIDESVEARNAVVELERTIDDTVEILNSKEACSLDEQMFSERYGDEYGGTTGSEPVVARTAVLKSADAFDLSVSNAAVEAMINILGGKSMHNSSTLVPVRRGADPLTEWDQNGNMIAAAFPLLFLRGGKSLPQGTWPTKFVKHLMCYYDGRFEKDTRFVATLFNQLQRHTAVRKAARVGSSRASTLLRLGNLASTDEFHQMLVDARGNPEAARSKRLNAYLLRILSLIGGCVPFSPFERATTRPKIGAMRSRYGVAQHWVTVAPPEHHDLELHRIAQLRMIGAWNQPGIIFQRKECKHEDLPLELRLDTRRKLALSNTYPGLSSRVFERRVAQIFNEIIMCKCAADTRNPRLMRVSRDYSQRRFGAYGRVAAHFAVIEPQVDGRLHIHMCVYGSTYHPELLSRITCSTTLRDRAAKWLESVCCTKFENEVHEWRKESLPNACYDNNSFLVAAQKRAAVTNFHAHTSTCFKGRRGKYMCRLARPAGIHDQPTVPLIISRNRLGIMSAGVPPIVAGHPLPTRTLAAIDAGYSPGLGQCFRAHDEGPILWELSRPVQDVCVVETNLVLAALTCSHTNSSIINGEDSGDMVEEYQQAYMTKDDVALKGAAAALMGAILHEKTFPSRASDSKSELRIAKYLATRTVNSFVGAHEWSHALMCIVDILPTKPKVAHGSQLKRRPPRVGFCFASSHPLYCTHRGYIRAKMLTPILGGAVPPTWKNGQANSKDDKQCDYLARYVLCTFTPWGKHGPVWPFDITGLQDLCTAWDRHTAPLIDRQRCRYIRNPLTGETVVQNIGKPKLATSTKRLMEMLSTMMTSLTAFYQKQLIFISFLLRLLLGHPDVVPMLLR
ncbi:hypothetical protein PHMEG_00014489 [Phytophthora megakarya]|uniref:Helitron helicase-like domain-containing protein n=1 Tax=Phytophthora megakarya TaxID=4795 RepID=A0A225W3U5_9STRA|nr:hypothetical protein PHMEG_00014489 [Phytophthora megakarya]